MSAKRKATAGELRNLMGQEELNAYVAYLKSKADVKLHLENLEKQQQ